MTKTVAETILSRASGQDARAGDVVIASVDGVAVPDAAATMTIDYFERMGAATLFDPTRVLFALDHYAPPASTSAANLHAAVRRFAEQHGAHLCEMGEGISHQRMIELGRVRPGGVLVGADSHTVTFGAFNAFATGLGSSDIAAAMATGRVWLRVPETIRVDLEGGLAPGVEAKDVVLKLLDQLGSDGADYRALEFHGPGVASLTISDRLVLANMATEMGAKCAIFPSDAVLEAHLRNLDLSAETAVAPGTEATYLRTVPVDLGGIAPLLARPHTVDDIHPCTANAGERVDMVFVGTCTGGRASDFRAFRDAVVRGGGIAAGVQVVLTPASRDVLVDIERDGTLGALLAMGAVLTTPGCGACCGTAGVLPSDGMTVLSTGNRNFRGRMGNPTASVFLASPKTCGASAAAGTIVDPRSLFA